MPTCVRPPLAFLELTEGDLAAKPATVATKVYTAYAAKVIVPTGLPQD